MRVVRVNEVNAEHVPLWVAVATPVPDSDENSLSSQPLSIHASIDAINSRFGPPQRAVDGIRSRSHASIAPRTSEAQRSSQADLMRCVAEPRPKRLRKRSPASSSSSPQGKKLNKKPMRVFLFGALGRIGVHRTINDLASIWGTTMRALPVTPGEGISGPDPC
jgi:hypothetical protein